MANRKFEITFGRVDVSNLETEEDFRREARRILPEALVQIGEKSGEIAWLVALAGHPRAITPLLKKFQETTLKGQPLKMRAKGKDGKTVVTTFSGRPN